MKLFFLLPILFIASVFARPGPRITGGEDATKGQFPYQISYQWGLFDVYEHMCGGSIISPQWILIAGHCVSEAPTIGDFKIVAGILDLTDDNPEKQEIAVVQKVVHPDYSDQIGPNDLALLKLEKPLVFGDLVQPINLPEAGAEISGDAVLSGWGAINDQIIPIMPNHLQTVTIPVLPNTDCVSAIDELVGGSEGNPFDTASNICTGPLEGGISACSGDSGGPLAQGNTIVGVVSWGMTPCGLPGAPSVYTKVSNFIDFIKENVDDLPTM